MDCVADHIADAVTNPLLLCKIMNQVIFQSIGFWYMQFLYAFHKIASGSDLIVSSKSIVNNYIGNLHGSYWHLAILDQQKVAYGKNTRVYKIGAPFCMASKWQQ